MEIKTKRKYEKRDEFVASVRKAKCGHVSKIGRYFKCEVCQPELPDDDDYIYCDWNDLENNCE
jgi:hypothetical protein